MKNKVARDGWGEFSELNCYEDEHSITIQLKYSHGNSKKKIRLADFCDCGDGEHIGSLVITYEQAIELCEMLALRIEGHDFE